MMTEKIRIAMIKRNMSVKELAARLGCTSQNLSGKFKRDNFSERELQEIAEILGCTFEGRFISKDTGEEI
ncbi:MAG: helix-turn-helix transcriptional regulator [Clostridia bacterium]|nr:helix-turn-helix transcriptional regulator [Clostridia bacterium]